MAPKPIDIALHIQIARRPRAVWPFLVDWERLSVWMQEASDFRVIGSQREGVGVEAEATVRIAGITTRDRIRVTQWQPPAVLEMAHMGWVQGTGYMELSPIEGGSDLFWRESLVPPWGRIGRMGMAMARPLMRRIFRRDLQLLKQLVEAET